MNLGVTATRYFSGDVTPFFTVERCIAHELGHVVFFSNDEMTTVLAYENRWARQLGDFADRTRYELPPAR